ncbi:MAG: arsenite methyltransferase [Fibrobacterota bacterium]|nr:arsenite methyltransferase [Fibrobacterota bacterium]QQS03430.1 MAG: arsenite methyltransferase [Fibrobacterota bacterium]
MSVSIEEQIRSKVREGYGAIAQAEGGCCGGASCCGSSPEVARELAVKLGYDPAILETLPEGTNLGLSCGNPQAIAELDAGETVLDLGSGAGFDVFLAAQAVGPTGMAIGVDMTSQMLSKARRNAVAFTERTGLSNVEFRLGEIEHLPVADATVDVVVSNCVLNLSPDKPQVWREIARVLKPGGRVAISDLALKKELPPQAKELSEALVGCVAGAVLVDEIWQQATDAGLKDVALALKPQYVAAMENIQDPLYQQILALLPSGEKLSDYIVSADISGHKPCAGCDGNCDCQEDSDLGKGPGGGDDLRLASENPHWHQTSSCCGAAESGCC